jgi:hypothetical protein
LRSWCQSCGLLEASEDFADKKQKGSQISVRGARAFIINYYAGQEIEDKSFDKFDTTPTLPKTGVVDDNWEKLRDKDGLWTDSALIEAGKEFSRLHKAQSAYFRKTIKEHEYSEKAISYSVLSAWAYIAGVLHKNGLRLQRHYKLADITVSDPLSARLLANARHKSDPENYRGLGTRADDKERGRVAELFYLQAEKGGGFTKSMIDLAIKKYHAKRSNLEVLEAERKLQNERI